MQYAFNKQDSRPSLLLLSLSKFKGNNKAYARTSQCTHFYIIEGDHGHSLLFVIKRYAYTHICVMSRQKSGHDARTSVRNSMYNLRLVFIFIYTYLHA